MGMLKKCGQLVTVLIEVVPSATLASFKIRQKEHEDPFASLLAAIEALLELLSLLELLLVLLELFLSLSRGPMRPMPKQIPRCHTCIDIS